jgi:hypothetical protein
MPSVYHGSTSRLLISQSGTGNPEIALSVTDWSLDMATDTTEVTAVGHTNKSYVQGLPNISGSLSAFLDFAFQTFHKARASADGCKMWIYPAYGDLTTYAYGPAWLSLSMTGSVGDAVKMSGNFVAAGEWSFFGKIATS